MIIFRLRVHMLSLRGTQCSSGVRGSPESDVMLLQEICDLIFLHAPHVSLQCHTSMHHSASLEGSTETVVSYCTVDLCSDQEHVKEGYPLGICTCCLSHDDRLHKLQVCGFSSEMETCSDASRVSMKSCSTQSLELLMPFYLLATTSPHSWCPPTFVPAITSYRSVHLIRLPIQFFWRPLCSYFALLMLCSESAAFAALAHGNCLADRLTLQTD
jgi:hypothetical protein